jgi:hypothetical protein
MNYYYDLPQDIISKIEDNVEEEYKKEWNTKMMLVNKIFEFACDIDEITDGIEEGMTFSDIAEVLGSDEGKLTFKGMEYQYYNLHLPYMRGEIKD